MKMLALVAAGVLFLSVAGPAHANPAGVSIPSLGSDSAKRAEKPKAKPLPPRPAAKPRAGAAGKSADVNLGSAARRELLKGRLQGGAKTAAGKPAPVKKRTS